MTRPRLRIEWDWEAAPSVKSAELRSTFASLKILVGDEYLTLVEDRESSSSRRTIHCSLYPFAEWIAYNWWFLLADGRPAGMMNALRVDAAFRSGKRSEWERHCVRGAGEGFLWPNLLIWPEGSYTRLVWRPDRGAAPDRPIRFLASGDAMLDPAEIEETLGGVVEAVLERLIDFGLDATPLAEEWGSIRNADRDEAAYCRAAARLGLDPYSEAAKYEDAIIRAADELDTSFLGELLDAADPARLADDLGWIRSAREQLAGYPQRSLALPSGVPVEWFRAWSGMDSGAGIAPWDRGYSGARAFRDFLRIGPAERFDIGEFLTGVVVRSPDRNLHAVGGGSAAVAIGREQLEDSQRFTLARALWNILSKPDSPFLITRARTEQQKAERAFAAELLAPAEGLAKVLGTRLDDAGVDELERAERHYGVSSLIIQRQIENQLTSV